MRHFFIATVLSLSIASMGHAQNVGLKRLDSGDDARAWEAVGRLDIAGTGFCTGALIAPHLVLTAAHCLFDRDSKKRIDHSDVQFLAGWRNGRAGAYREVRRAVVHPAFVYDGDVSSERVRFDVALLELQRPIRNTRIQPFATAERPRKGDSVGVVSYAKDRAEAPSLQEVCKVLAQQDGVLVTDCSVDFGSSGAPIFSFANGVAQIVSVVSAKAEVEGERVSLGTSLGATLALLKEQLLAGKGGFKDKVVGRKRVLVGQAVQETGAKFVKP